MTAKGKLHFLGINGSGIVGAACLAKERGFDVDGCDLVESSDYSKQLLDLGITVRVGQSKEHLEGVDKLVVSPAIFFRDNHKNIEEVNEAEKYGVEVIRWQQFLDTYLAKGRQMIGVCGTHGKTTTTTVVANLLESCGADPSAIIGGINKRWNRNYRNGRGKYFVCEADEYGYNFTYYHPKYILINNLEMEHPEFFNNLDEYRDNFRNFIGNIKRGGTIIFNADDQNVIGIVNDCMSLLERKKVKLLSYSIGENYKDDRVQNYRVEIKDEFFILDNTLFNYIDSLRGVFNVRNTAMAVVLLKELGFGNDLISKSCKNCEIAKRRMETVYSTKDFVVYDDYAHHHTQVLNNLKSLRQNIDTGDRIVAVLEPHLISRFTGNSTAYIEAMSIADYPIITKFFKSREKHLDEPDMGPYLKGTGVVYEPDFDLVVDRVISIAGNHYGRNRLHIVVMGAGISYRLTRKIMCALVSTVFPENSERKSIIYHSVPMYSDVKAGNIVPVV
ncbi:MAG: Mur ligase domain-containing protein [Rickettsiales bacterium]|jgi:UDP-N-acetylmuramate--alanine ligase|nr:Mur ligase domain-containing protein [Rickettsiales bacterium]